MGIIDSCLLNDEKAKIPSEIGSKYEFNQNVSFYRNTFQNSPLYNEYLQRQNYRTLVIEPS